MNVYTMKKIVPAIVAIVMSAASLLSCQNEKESETLTISRAELIDKIKGGWAGQTIACTYGGPTEFAYPGTMIDDSVEIKWPDHYIKWYFENGGGLYDDVYMDLTFLDVFDRLGLDAPADSFAHAFATAPYPLWHANQAARYNILRGLKAPATGYWKNNPHADDIDFQIEADFAGLMSPGMPATACVIADTVGHIMNYGDGWYGGVYVAAMYSLAFVKNDIAAVVEEALDVIPSESNFHKMISDVIEWHRQYPDDWRRTWQEHRTKYPDDRGCPCCVFENPNIDASINCSYVVMGLLYGNGDFDRTIDIATRCGQDSDCNPATAGGILATMIGYSKIPERWMPNLREVEDMNFAYTDISLNKATDMTLRLALELIEKNGGRVSGNKVTIRLQQPEPVRFEQSFEGIRAKHRVYYHGKMLKGYERINFKGTGIVLRGVVKSTDKAYEAQLLTTLDGEVVTMILPADFTRRSDEFFWKFDLESADHALELQWLNPTPDASIELESAIIYDNRY